MRLILLLLLITIQIFGQNDFTTQRKKFDPSRDPFKDLSIAIDEASKLNKRIILDVGGEWCKWCHIIDKFIDEQTEINEYLNNHYIVLKINYSEENKNENFLTRYPEIEGYPHFFILEKNGELLHSQNTGLLEEGKSYDPEKFMNFLKKWSIKK